VGLVNIFSVDRDRHDVGCGNIPGVVLLTSDKSVAGNDEEWKRRQIDIWTGWSGPAWMEGLDVVDLLL
jgi:hypothetical protein